MDRALSRLTTLGLHLEPAKPETHLNGIACQQTSGMSTGAGSKRARGTPGDALDDTAVYIVGVARTPLGSFQGGLSSLSATDLGGIAIRAALERAGVSPNDVDEVYMGNVCSANLGQAPARQAALKAGLPFSADCTTVNKVCSSGMKALTIAAASLQLGVAQVAVAGGMESMSNIPYYVPSARGGARLGHAQLVDGMVADGLWDPHHDIHMGECAELCAEEHGITRAEQDAHALESAARARRAQAGGVTAWEVVPVEVKTRRGTAVVSQDEALAKMDPEKLVRLRPSFRPEGPDAAPGTITAGNASPLTDGAAALVLASGAAVARLGLRPLAQLLGSADAAREPREYTTAPSASLPKALARAGVAAADVDAWEINEAFSVVDLVNRRLLGLDPERVNALGGAVALGHPIGCSGARVVVTLINALRSRGGTLGAAGICNGGGGSTAVVLRLMPQAE
ncbi:putative acetyl-CoA acetyltransferase, cytosolic 2 [Auxenochlorella protothecoides]|nr:putative acetyl-CoA acetyltransferase, cytosolic 2 [Auxenochlorella protothecoides]KFM28548.1 putative acetyl-CoA acetyltransferase, cytosolic 2 [Auxenochlorella protothecoides]RMZ53294.1 hypothetical protein APUTEX25_004782 [Auxenochlorella protothecoides]|eukprot:RMZ53294.1 hypothetical protein APUTEX25_004782 [Auxenochlorella protothecoides]